MLCDTVPLGNRKIIGKSSVVVEADKSCGSTNVDGHMH